MHLPPKTGARVVLLAVWTIALQAGGLVAARAADHEHDRHRDPAASLASPVVADLASTAVPAEITTTTAAPPPSAPVTTVPPAPKVVTARAAGPATPAPPPPPPRPAPSPAERVRAAFDTSVPAAWQAAIAVRFEIIAGGTSWGFPDGLIQIGTYHANGSTARLRATVAHEFGHLIAFRYGSKAYNGAAPSGWPAYGSNPAEAWADCVSQAFTGVIDPSHGLPPCQGESLRWTQAWLAKGPPA